MILAASWQHHEHGISSIIATGCCEVPLASAHYLHTESCHFRALQDSEVCNAGHGSNLSFEGVVECDASVMEGDGTFGAVGAVSGMLAC